MPTGGAASSLAANYIEIFKGIVYNRIDTRISQPPVVYDKVMKIPATLAGLRESSRLNL